jgi:hypothetical protein
VTRNTSQYVTGERLDVGELVVRGKDGKLYRATSSSKPEDKIGMARHAIGEGEPVYVSAVTSWVYRMWL